MKLKRKEYNPEFDEVICHYYDIDEWKPEDGEVCNLGFETECCNHCYMNEALFNYESNA